MLLDRLKGQHFGLGALNNVGVVGFGEGKVEPGEHVDVVADVGRFVGDEFAQLGEDAADFLLFQQLPFAHGVVLLDDLDRLDKERRAAGRLIVNDAVDLPLVLGTHGNHIAALALRDQRILQVGLNTAALHQSIQRAEQALLSLTQLLAHARQFAAGVIGNLGPVVDAAADLR